jgi:uncharacterized Zn-finger protein
MYSENEETETNKDELLAKQSLECRICSRLLSSKQNLREHLFIHSGERPYKCTEPGCSKTFRQGSLLSIHRRIHKEINNNLQFQEYRKRKLTFPKLTEMISLSNPVHSILERNEIILTKEKMSENDFYFIEKFIKTTKTLNLK